MPHHAVWSARIALFSSLCKIVSLPILLRWGVMRRRQPPAVKSQVMTMMTTSLSRAEVRALA